MTIKKNKSRNPIAQALYEDRRFKLKTHNPKKKPPKEPTVEEAIIQLQEEEEQNEEND